MRPFAYPLPGGRHLAGRLVEFCRTWKARGEFYFILRGRTFARPMLQRVLASVFLFDVFVFFVPFAAAAVCVFLLWRAVCHRASLGRGLRIRRNERRAVWADGHKGAVCQRCAVSCAGIGSLCVFHFDGAPRLANQRLAVCRTIPGQRDACANRCLCTSHIHGGQHRLHGIGFSGRRIVQHILPCFFELTRIIGTCKRRNHLVRAVTPFL